jgi:predicted nucleotidyltransferase
MSFLRQPLDIVLSSTGSVRVLRALLGHGGAVSVSRLAAVTKLTPEGVRGILGDLEQTGLVEMLGEGRARLYRAVADHPIAAALAGMFRAEEARFHDIRRAVEVCASHPHILAVWLFGSAARGTDRVDSDLDLAVVIDAAADEVARLADALRDALREPERRLGFVASVVAMSPDDLRQHIASRSPLLADLLEDGRALKGPPPAWLVDRLTAEIGLTTT